MSAASPDARLIVDGTTGVPETPQTFSLNVAGNTVALAWTPPQTGTLPTDYVIEASIAGGPFIAITRTSGTTFTAAGVPPGAYAVRVRASSGVGVGAPTAAISVIVP
jgi:predicted phage tail protein